MFRNATFWIFGMVVFAALVVFLYVIVTVSQKGLL